MYYSKCQELSAFVVLLAIYFTLQTCLNVFTKIFLDSAMVVLGVKDWINGQACWAKEQ